MNRVGIDMVEVSRIERALGQWGESFLLRVYTDSEISAYRGKTQSLAARFAGKEAVMKALGTGGPLRWREIEILSAPDGTPVVNLHGQTRLSAEKLNIQGVSISLSHTRDYAIACAAVSATTIPPSP